MFNFNQEKTFAGSLVAQLEKDLPPRILENKRKILSVNKITRILENTCEACREYQKQNNIGFLRRVVLLNTVKWDMKNKGYAEDFIETVTESLIVHLTKK
ncbi:MAG: hypothetical protein RLZZ612_1623 [Pseudomonadota bacterium]|jgi:hypothetical protein